MLRPVFTGPLLGQLDFIWSRVISVEGEIAVVDFLGTKLRERSKEKSKKKKALDWEELRASVRARRRQSFPNTLLEHILRRWKTIERYFVASPATATLQLFFRKMQDRCPVSSRIVDSIDSGKDKSVSPSPQKILVRPEFAG